MNISAFSVWTDADSCPSPVRELIVRFCLRLSLPLYFVANRTIPLKEHPLCKMIVCDSHADAADDYIVENASSNDIVITRDIPLANRLINRNIVVINDRGTLYNKNNISERLSIRNFNKELYDNGIISDKIKTLNKKDINNFANCFDREIQKKLKELVN